jgi:5'-nucleotidase
MAIRDTDPETDQIAVRENFISVTPIHYELTDLTQLERMKHWSLGDLK